MSGLTASNHQQIVGGLGAEGSTAAIVASLPGVSDADLAAAYGHCRAITRARARNFYYGLRLTPEPRRSAIFSIYAWMRAADDEADAEAPAAARRARLAAYRDLTAKLLSDQPIDWSTLAPFWPAFAATVRSYPIDPSLFSAMLDGLEEDLEPPAPPDAYPTDADLTRYCYRVASTVGLTCISIWGLRPGVNPGEARRLAEERGQAFQRTNILRDFAQDYDSTPSRVYLPADSFAAAGLSPRAVREWSDPVRCREFIQRHAAQARAFYESSAPLVGMVAADCAPTLWAMTTIYSGLLRLIEQDPQRIVAPKRIRLPASRKALIALRATMRSRTSGW